MPERWRPLLLTAIFTGLRSSELRGLRWEDVDLKAGELHVRQRADRYNVIGSPKSKAGHRAVPLGPEVRNVLREWKLRCPRSELGLVFPTSTGGIDRHTDIVRRFKSIVRKAGLTDASEASRNTPGCTRCGISMRAGASIPRTAAARGCRPRWCRNGSGTHLS